LPFHLLWISFNNTWIFLRGFCRCRAFSAFCASLPLPHLVFSAVRFCVLDAFCRSFTRFCYNAFANITACVLPFYLLAPFPFLPAVLSFYRTCVRSAPACAVLLPGSAVSLPARFACLPARVVWNICRAVLSYALAACCLACLPFGLDAGSASACRWVCRLPPPGFSYRLDCRFCAVSPACRAVTLPAVLEHRRFVLPPAVLPAACRRSAVVAVTCRRLPRTWTPAVFCRFLRRLPAAAPADGFSMAAAFLPACTCRTSLLCACCHLPALPAFLVLPRVLLPFLDLLWFCLPDSAV